MAAGCVVRIVLTANYFNATSVELRCDHNSSQRVAVGFYRKVPSSNAFARTVAIGGNTENCMVTPLPDNVKCDCMSEQNMRCIISHLRPTNDGDEWKCAIPCNGIAVFSNIARLSFSGAKCADEETPTSVVQVIIISLIVVFALLKLKLACSKSDKCFGKKGQGEYLIDRTRKENVNSGRIDYRLVDTHHKLPT